MRMFHHLRSHHRTWTFWPAAPRRQTPRTAYVPRLDRLEGRIAMSVGVSYNPSSHLLSVVEDGADRQIDIHVVKNAGQDPFVKVTNDNHVSFSQSVPSLAGLDVQAGGSESSTSLTGDAYEADVLVTADGNGGYNVASTVNVTSDASFPAPGLPGGVDVLPMPILYSPVPTVQTVRGTPPVQTGSLTPPVQTVRSTPPVQTGSLTPPVQTGSLTPPVQTVRGTPIVQTGSLTPPVQTVRGTPIVQTGSLTPPVQTVRSTPIVQTGSHTARADGSQHTNRAAV